MSDIVYVRRASDRLSPIEYAGIADLLEEAFPGTFEGRTYFKQLPCFRFLAKHDEMVVGQVGVTHRVVRVGLDPMQIFGIIDLCVLDGMRGQGIGRNLVELVKEAATAANVNFALLYGDDHRLYEACGFRLVSNACTYLAIDSHMSLGLVTGTFEDCMMVLSTSGETWPSDTPVDLLGYLF